MDDAQVLLGSVGWDNETDLYDLDGDVKLVKVQVFEGRTLTKDLHKGRALGRKIKAQIHGPTWDLPGKDERVVVLVPHGMSAQSGAAIIAFSLGAAPTTDFDSTHTKTYPFGRDVVAAVGGTKVHVKSDQVLIGDDTARFLAHSSEVTTALNAILVELTALNVWLNGAIVSFGGVFTDPGAGLTTTLVTATTTAIANVTAVLSTLPTTKAKGT